MKEFAPVSLGGKEIWPPFTIPSGIITVNPDAIQRLAREVPIGLITTKSVGVNPYGGYPEPVFSQYSADGLSTAIGLSTPGYKVWLEEMRGIYPLEGKFLLVSVFGDTVEEFVEVAQAVAKYADGLELNFCCPHSLRYGEAVAKHGDLTVVITEQVRKLTDKPIVVKLTPNIEDIGAWARNLVRAGADAIAAIGPTTAVTVIDKHVGRPVLSFESGGLSGPAILQRGLECIRAIRAVVDVPIIAGGGISTARDVTAYREAGGNIFAVGTSLAGMDTAKLRYFFTSLLEEGAEEPAPLTFDGLHLTHAPYRVVSVDKTDDVAVLRFDRSLESAPGQFVFAWVPGVGEKPFSIAGSDPLVLAIRGVGKVSRALAARSPGEEVMLRGPFGKPFPLHSRAVLVAGGCGAVPLRFLAERLKNPLIVLGAADRSRLLFAEEFASLGETIIATDDGSAGLKGTAVDALAGILADGTLDNAFFYNCGPEPMMAAAVELELKHAPKERIAVCLERHTVCGVGLCGKCSVDGYRACVDGPLFTLESLGEPIGYAQGEPTAFGRYRRGPSGAKEQMNHPGSCHA